VQIRVPVFYSRALKHTIKLLTNTSYATGSTKHKHHPPALALSLSLSLWCYPAAHSHFTSYMIPSLICAAITPSATDLELIY